MRTRSLSQGFGVIEIIVAAAIFITITAVAASTWQLYIRIANASTNRAQAAMLIEEASEALQILRDTSWNGTIALTTLNTPYDVVWNGSTYSLATPPATIQGRFTRSIVMSQVLRDGITGDISTSGSVDPKTRKVVITISTLEATPTLSIESEMLIHNTYGN
ncbi:MAG: hypothetical protein RLY66_28 [Candidatus Parcubacteria bacterium]|jgi:type II secretory pathway pseudopilin PulG